PHNHSLRLRCDLCGSAVSLFEPMIHRRSTPRGHGAELKSGHYPGKAALTTANLLCKLTQLTTIIMHRAGRLPQRRHYWALMENRTRHEVNKLQVAAIS